ncbi:MAG: hypothetical protein GYA57_19755 [Myxococcales bacterium]|nr:hypothetical protein [Myxococcales bacterium]
MVPVAVLVVLVAVLAAAWLLRGRRGEEQTPPERRAVQLVVPDAGPDMTPVAAADVAGVDEVSTGPAAPAPPVVASVPSGPASTDAGAVDLAGGPAGAAPPPGEAGAVEPAVSADAPDAPATPVPVASDAAGRRRPAGGRMTPAARQFHNAIVVGCWRDNPPEDPRPVEVVFRVTYDQYGTMRTFLVQGDVSDQFKRCVGLRGQSFRFDPLPPETTVAWRAVLGRDDP